MDYSELAVKWLIRLVILYFVLSLLEGIVNWKVWVVIAICVLVLFLIVDKIYELRSNSKKEEAYNKI
jgi:uncharacterized membrane protein YdjX (TVP38/TMEM64 family)